MSWARLIELLELQQACLAERDFVRHRDLVPQIETELASLKEGPTPTDAERTRVDALLDSTLGSSIQRVARTGAALRRTQQRSAEHSPQLIDRRG